MDDTFVLPVTDKKDAMRKCFYAFIALTIVTISCTQEKDIDEDLQFAINTAPYSRGMAFYELPESTEFSKIPQDPRNRITASKVELGKLLFHETGFGTVGNFEQLRGSYSCASCHHAGAGFQANMPQGIGDGGIGFGLNGEGRIAARDIEVSKVDVQPVRTPTVLNSAYQTNMLWNGQFGALGVNEGTNHLWPDDTPIATNRLGYDGVETQAIAGLTVHRQMVDETTVTELGYKEMFDEAFPDFTLNRRYSLETAGLAIAAFERTVLANEAPFQRWIKGDLGAMTELEKEGAILFFTKGKCTTCHNGPSLAKMEFHAIAMDDFNPSEVLNFSTDDPSTLGRASFTKDEEDEYKFKVPQLYNLRTSPFFGHGASFNSIREVIEYKNIAVPQNPNVSASKISEHFVPLRLKEEEVTALTAFIKNGLHDPNLQRYVPSSVLSGGCIPNNDWMSKDDLGCN